MKTEPRYIIRGSVVMAYLRTASAEQSHLKTKSGQML